MEEYGRSMEKYGMDPAAAGPESGQSMGKVWKSMEKVWNGPGRCGPGISTKYGKSIEKYGKVWNANGPLSVESPCREGGTTAKGKLKQNTKSQCSMEKYGIRHEKIWKSMGKVWKSIE